jgi:hypothetical protein
VEIASLFFFARKCRETIFRLPHLITIARQESKFHASTKIRIAEFPTFLHRLVSYMFGKKSKKSPKPPKKHIHLEIPINIAVSRLDFREELKTDPIGNQNLTHRDPEPNRLNPAVALDENNPRPSRIGFHKEKSESQALYEPETSVTRGAIDRDTKVEHRNYDPTSECSLSLLSRLMSIRSVIFFIRRERR